MIAPMTLMAAGCANRVVSDTPRFSEEDGRTAELPKDGLWLVDTKRCEVQVDRPVDEWPNCAMWHIVRDGLAFEAATRDRTAMQTARDGFGSLPMLTVGGTPMIQQLTDCRFTSSGSVAAEPDGGAARGRPQRKIRYCYNAIEVMELDADRRIVEFDVWPVLCGPWPPKGENITQRPWAGIKVRGENCLAESETALRAAAMESRDVAAQAGIVSRVRWIRAGSEE